MSFSPIGDTIAVVKLAYELYNRFIIVARDAPDSLKALFRDLQRIKGILFLIHNHSSHSATVRDVLSECFRTLRELRDLTDKYENLAWSDRGVFFKRLKFASEQGMITRLREKFRAQQELLQLALTADGRKLLDETVSIEGTTSKTSLRVEESVTELDSKFCSHCNDLTRRPTPTTVDSEVTLTNQHGSTPDLRLNSIRIGCTCCQNHAGSGMDSSSKDSAQSLSVNNRSLSSSTASTTFSNGGLSQGKAGSNDIDTEFANSPIGHWRQVFSSPKSQSTFLLYQGRERHNTSIELQDGFRKSYQSLRESFNTESWLRIATWWLIKSRLVRRSIVLAQRGLQIRKNSIIQNRDGWHISVSEEQAYADLLKASWILEEVILVKLEDKDCANNHVRRLVKDLVTHLDRELRKLRKLDSIQQYSNDEVFLQQDLFLLESFEQEIETFEDNVPMATDDPISPHRWFATDQDNAGTSQERVIFRTFVNAQLGGRQNRSKSSSAPYMLLLWTRKNESDLLISLCNQRGTVNLSRRLLAEDLERYWDTSGTVPLHIDFPSLEAELMFLSMQDVTEFLAQPSRFFAAMKWRSPRPGELAIYQAPISVYSDVSAQSYLGTTSSTKMVSGRDSSCGLRIYESLSGRYWETTRRLVISSSPDDVEPGCLSHWLPLGHIRILVDCAKATVAWSDCGQLETTSDQCYGAQHSFVYKPELPNRKIQLDFMNETEARRFRDHLLLPTVMPPQITTKLDVSSPFQSTRIYRLFDSDEPDNHGYHAIAVTKKSPQGPHMTEIFFAYRDLDWAIEMKNSIPSVVELSGLVVPAYESTIPKTQYKPNSNDTPPDFSCVTENPGQAHLELGCDHDLFHVMHALTGWRLKLFQAVEKLVLVGASVCFGSSKRAFKDVDIQLWEKASSEGRSRTQLAIRLDGQTKDRWITTSLSDDRYSIRSNTVEIQRLAIQRGVGIDTKEMTAKNRDTEERPSTRRKWKLAMTFKDDSDKDEFLRSSGLIRRHHAESFL